MLAVGTMREIQTGAGSLGLEALYFMKKSIREKLNSARSETRVDRPAIDLVAAYSTVISLMLEESPPPTSTIGFLVVERDRIIRQKNTLQAIRSKG